MVVISSVSQGYTKRSTYVAGNRAAGFPRFVGSGASAVMSLGTEARSKNQMDTPSEVSQSIAYTPPPFLKGDMDSESMRRAKRALQLPPESDDVYVRIEPGPVRVWVRELDSTSYTPVDR